MSLPENEIQESQGIRKGNTLYYRGKKETIMVRIKSKNYQKNKKEEKEEKFKEEEHKKKTRGKRGYNRSRSSS